MVDIVNFNELVNNFRQEILDNKDLYIKYKQVQIKRHKKKRINKKWLKRYGTKPVPVTTVELFEKIEEIMNVGIEEKTDKLIDGFVNIRDVNM